MSRVIISIQHGGPRKETYLRKEIGTLNKRSVLEAVEEMLDDQPGHTIGKLKSTFPKRQPAKKPDEEVLPGVEVSARVEEAMAGV
jgi:hypothetical protein